MQSINVYSDVVNAGLILARKQKYTMRDVNRVITDSLFKPVQGQSVSVETAVFIVKCSAVFHGTDWSDAVGKALNNVQIIKG